jgi:hypothetical protein
MVLRGRQLWVARRTWQGAHAILSWSSLVSTLFACAVQASTTVHSRSNTENFSFPHFPPLLLRILIVLKQCTDILGELCEQQDIPRIANTDAQLICASYMGKILVSAVGCISGDAHTFYISKLTGCLI